MHVSHEYSGWYITSYISPHSFLKGFKDAKNATVSYFPMQYSKDNDRLSFSQHFSCKPGLFLVLNSYDICVFVLCRKWPFGVQVGVSHWGKITIFVHLTFEIMWFLRKMRFWKWDFCEKWASEMSFLWKMRFWKCDFC